MKKGSAPQATPATLRVVAGDYSLQAPETIPAGLVTVWMVNQGKEPHQAQIVRLGEGKTLADFNTAMQAMAKGPGGPPPAWMAAMGGPNAAFPGDSSNATLVLQPGTYVLVCHIPSPDGVPHVMKGMATSVVVSGAPVAAPQEPAADVVITTSDYSFTLSTPLTAGAHTIRVENPAGQPHEVLLVALQPGKKAADFVTWVGSGMQGPPPITRLLGGVGALDAGTHQSFAVTLEKGDYGLVCFLPDAKDGKPHVMHGMMQDFTVN